MFTNHPQVSTPPANVCKAYGSRAQLAAEPLPSPKSFVEEVTGWYRYDRASTATADGWIVLTSTAGGRFIYDDLELTLPILGSGGDDWPNFATANSACAAAGVILRLGPGLYEAKSRQVMASGLHLVATPGTRIRCTIPSQHNLDTAFTGQGVFTGTTTLAASTALGDQKVRLTGNIGIAVGDFIELFISSASFRGAIYQVIAYDSSTNTATLDRPLRMTSASQTSTASFPAGGYAARVNPAKDILLEFNGASIFGACNRYIEFIVAWDCNVRGPVYLGDGTTVTAVERLISLDAPSYNCHAEGIIGDGGGTTVLGLSFESGEADSYDDCSVRGCGNGITFQDGIDCVANRCELVDNYGGGAIFTAASDNLLGADGCRIVGGSYSGNAGPGIIFERGSSRCTVEGASVISNVGDGIVFASSAATPWKLYDNSVSGRTIIRAPSSNGLELTSASVRTRISDTESTDSVNGVTVAAGAVGTYLCAVDVSRNGAGMIFAADVDCESVVCSPNPGAANTQLTVSAGTTRMRGSRIELTTNKAVTINVAGVLDIDSTTVVQVPGGIGIQVTGGGMVRLGGNTSIIGSGASGYGINAVNGTVQVGTGALIEGKLNLGASGIYSFGVVTLPAAGSISIAYPRLQASDVVVLSPMVGTGVYLLTQTPGTGFTLTGKAGDQYRWKVV